MKIVQTKKYFSLLITILILFGTLSGCSNKDNASVIVIDETITANSSIADELPSKENQNMLNLLSNGTFNENLLNWEIYTESQEAATISMVDQSLMIHITDPGTTENAIQIYCDKIPLTNGNTYQLSFTMSATTPCNVGAKIQLNGGDFQSYIEAKVPLSVNMDEFSYEFTMEKDNPSARLCFNLGNILLPESMESCDIIIDNVSLLLLDENGTASVDNRATDTVNININQVGYLPDDYKIAVFRYESAGGSFFVLNENKEIVFTGQQTDPIQSQASGEFNCTGDFSMVTQPGTYTISDGRGSQSFSFVIGENRYDQLFLSMFQMFYLQRCGMDLDVNLAGDFCHVACHMSDAVIYGTNITKDVSGGWHDAGDYGRNVVTGALTVVNLFEIYSNNSMVLQRLGEDNLNIPESGNGVPDILDEARYELEWLLKMQDEESGGVYHKVTAKTYPGEVLPQDEVEQLVIAPVSTTATADFAAVMAMAGKYYLEYDSYFAKRCENAAIKAWVYLENNPASIAFVNPTEIVTAEFSDSIDGDERYFAAIELFITTQNEKYLWVLTNIAEKGKLYSGYSWSDVGSYANEELISYIDNLTEEPDPILKVYCDKVKANMQSQAQNLLKLAKEDAYGISLGTEYYCGSNGAIAANGRSLLVASMNNGTKEDFASDEENAILTNDYVNYAKEHLDYILGANSLSISFVTGFGQTTPKNTHHRPSIVLEASMPGMLVGGANKNLEDTYAASALNEVAPAKCYIDNAESYSTNEVAVYRNSQMLFLLANFME